MNIVKMEALSVIIAIHGTYIYSVSLQSIRGDERVIVNKCT
jgi:hypothetical protein